MSLRMTMPVAVALSAIEPAFYPDIVGSLRYAGPGSGVDHRAWFEQYVEWIQSRQPTDLLAWLRLSADQLVEWGDGLIGRTTFFDPVRRWVDLIRLFAPEKWNEVTGPVRLALDHRIAAELLFKLREDLALADVAAPLEPPPARAWTPQHERLNRPVEELDQVLSEFGISPYPSLVLALEGETEMILVGRSMDHLNVPGRRNYIELFDVGGNTKDYGLLASYISVPELGRAIRPDLILLARPLTRLLIVTIPRTSYARRPTAIAGGRRLLARSLGSFRLPIRLRRRGRRWRR